MVLFDAQGKLKRYTSPNEILEEWYSVRLQGYVKRKSLLVEKSNTERQWLSTKARFIAEVVEGTITLHGRSKADILTQLDEKGFSNVDEYDKLLSMPLSSLTLEKVDKLNAQCLQLQEELTSISATSETTMWLKDIDEFLLAYDSRQTLLADEGLCATETMAQNTKKKATKPEKAKGKQAKRMDSLSAGTLIEPPECEASTRLKPSKGRSGPQSGHKTSVGKKRKVHELETAPVQMVLLGPSHIPSAE